MDKERFLKELDFLLQDIPDDERDEALQYYQDYFDEAGSENESRVIEELESPEKVAALIKAGLDERFDESVEFNEKGMKNSGYSYHHEVIEPEIIDSKEQHHYRNDYHTKGNPKHNRIALIILTVFGVIFGLPIIGAGIGLVMAIFGVVVAFAFSIIAISIAGLVIFVLGLVKGILMLSTLTGAGLLAIGLAFLSLALSGSLMIAGIWIIKLIPEFVRKIAEIGGKIIDKVGELL